LEGNTHKLPTHPVRAEPVEALSFYLRSTTLRQAQGERRRLVIAIMHTTVTEIFSISGQKLGQILSS
jgi:hypothetical protein